MKTVLYKLNYQSYNNSEYHSSTPIGYRDIRKTEDSFFGLRPSNEETIKRPVFVFKNTNKEEKSYVENYGNPIWSIRKDYCMIVIEKYDDKVSLKLFTGYRMRNVGKVYFKKHTNLRYLTINIKTGDFYSGSLTDYHKKKCKKTINRNSFVACPLSVMHASINNCINSCKSTDVDTKGVSRDIITQFMNQIPCDSPQIPGYSYVLFKFYLDKRGVKYPNNFNSYRSVWVGREIKKVLKKQNNRMVDSFMVCNGLKGSKLKKYLHVSDKVNLNTYKQAKALFGEDWINQDKDDIILHCLNYDFGTWGCELLILFEKIISIEEKKRVYKIFKEIVVEKKFNFHTFIDHIRYYLTLKEYGEENLQWTSSTTDDNEFNLEHIEWSNRVQKYKQGVYTRIYPQYMYDKLSIPIVTDNCRYYSILLDNSDNYNQESQLQSNCVKTYIADCGSIIISLRKGSKDSIERATVEYSLTNQNNVVKISRVQYLGRFNGRLSEEWNEVLLTLDSEMLLIINDKRFETVNIKREIFTGEVSFSKSIWSGYGNLKWENPTILFNNLYFI